MPAIVILLASFALPNYAFDGRAQTVTYSVRVLGLVPFFWRTRQFGSFRSVRYHRWVVYQSRTGPDAPAREEKRHIVLATEQGRGWLVGDDRRYWTLAPCTRSDALEISRIAGLPFEEIEQPSDF